MTTVLSVREWTVTSEVQLQHLKKFFKKLLKNPLTKDSKCAIIRMYSRESNKTNLKGIDNYG